MQAMSLEFEVFEDKLSPGDWRVEAVDYASEGECYMAIFTGSRARQRAEEYANWRNGASAFGGTVGI